MKMSCESTHTTIIHSWILLLLIHTEAKDFNEFTRINDILDLYTNRTSLEDHTKFQSHIESSEPGHVSQLSIN